MGLSLDRQIAEFTGDPEDIAKVKKAEAELEANNVNEVEVEDEDVDWEKLFAPVPKTERTKADHDADADGKNCVDLITGEKIYNPNKVERIEDDEGNEKVVLKKQREPRKAGDPKVKKERKRSSNLETRLELFKAELNRLAGDADKLRRLMFNRRKLFADSKCHAKLQMKMYDEYGDQKHFESAKKYMAKMQQDKHIIEELLQPALEEATS